jgi:hypothetical protein
MAFTLDERRELVNIFSHNGAPLPGSKEEATVNTLISLLGGKNKEPWSVLLHVLESSMSARRYFWQTGIWTTLTRHAARQNRCIDAVADVIDLLLMEESVAADFAARPGHVRYLVNLVSAETSEFIKCLTTLVHSTDIAKDQVIAAGFLPKVLPTVAACIRIEEDFAASRVVAILTILADKPRRKQMLYELGFITGLVAKQETIQPVRPLLAGAICRFLMKLVHYKPAHETMCAPPCTTMLIRYLSTSTHLRTYTIHIVRRLMTSGAHPDVGLLRKTMECFDDDLGEESSEAVMVIATRAPSEILDLFYQESMYKSVLHKLQFHGDSRLAAAAARLLAKLCLGDPAFVSTLLPHDIVGIVRHVLPKPSPDVDESAFKLLSIIVQSKEGLDDCLAHSWFLPTMFTMCLGPDTIAEVYEILTAVAKDHPGLILDRLPVFNMFADVFTSQDIETRRAASQCVHALFGEPTTYVDPDDQLRNDFLRMLATCPSAGPDIITVIVEGQPRSLYTAILQYRAPAFLARIQRDNVLEGTTVIWGGIIESLYSDNRPLWSEGAIQAMVTNDIPWEPTFKKDMLALLESNTGDLVLVAEGGVELRAHSFVLKARSPYFATYLSDVWNPDATIDMGGDECVLRAVLYYMYCGAPLLFENARDVLLLANKLGLLPLQAICEYEIAMSVGSDVVSSVFSFAQATNSYWLQRYCLYLNWLEPGALADQEEPDRVADRWRV